MRATLSTDGFSRFTVVVRFRIGYSEFYSLLATLTVQEKPWPRTRSRMLVAVKALMEDHGESLRDCSYDLNHIRNRRIQIYLHKMFPELRAEIDYVRALEEDEK